MFTCTDCMWQFFSYGNCHSFEPAGNFVLFITPPPFFFRVTTNNYVLTFYPPSPPLLSSLSHYENKYCKRKSFVNLCTVLTECMHITWTTCSTVTISVLHFQKKILGPAGPQVFIFGRQNKHSGRQKLYLRTNGFSL